MSKYYLSCFIHIIKMISSVVLDWLSLYGLKHSFKISEILRGAKFCRFGMTWGGVIDGRDFIFGWNMLYIIKVNFRWHFNTVAFVALSCLSDTELMPQHSNSKWKHDISVKEYKGRYAPFGQKRAGLHSMVLLWGRSMLKSFKCDRI